MENSKSLLVGAVVLLVAILGYAGYRQMNAAGPVEKPTATSTPEEVLPLAINAKHLFENGTHTYHGVVTTPTPCYDVTATATSPDAGATYVITITTKDRGEVCAQVLTDKEFEVSFTGNPYTVQTTLDGKPAQLNVIEVTSKEGLLGPFDFKS